jgi:curved DNA-binding protein
MKFKDYYASLGLERNASEADIKKAYRKLAHKYHPDVSKEPGAEARFKEIAEAYQTLKDPEKRSAYDKLGQHEAGEEFRPPPDWGTQYTGREESFEGINLADLFAGLAAGRGGHPGAGQRGSFRGEDYELRIGITLAQAYRGTLLDLNLSMPDYDAQGHRTHVPRSFKVRVPKGATDGQRLRLAGKGGKGFNGGSDGDLYLTVELQPHRLYRVSGHDLYLDLPVAPWEAALGATVEVPTPGGNVQMKIPAGTPAGQTLRLAGRGLPRPKEGHGDLHAIVRIVLPDTLTDAERASFRELAAASPFAPRATMLKEAL